MKKNVLIGLLLTGFGIILTLNINAQEEKDEQFTQQDIPKYGFDSAQCVMELSLYREFYKQWKKSKVKSPTINDAIPHWRWVYLNCPRATKNIYIDGANILEYMIENAETKERKDKLIDTLMMMYDKRIHYFDQEGYVLGRKGYDLYRFRTEDYEEVYNIFKRSVELECNDCKAPILVYYFRTAIKMATTGKADSTIIVETYDIVSEIVDYNLNKYEKTGKQSKIESWQNIKNNVEITFEPYATCEDLIAIYEKKFEENPNDVELLKKITDILDKKKCNDTKLFFEASVNLYNEEPTPEAALMLGKMFINEKNYEKALKYMKEAKSISDEEARADAYYYIAFCYQMLDQFTKSREAAYKSIENNPDNGKPYILIGDLYAASSELCATDDLAKKSVYWVAVDKYYQAKSIDPSVEDIANQRIASYSRYFPTKETIFFHDYNEGDTYKVGGWINEETKVRSVD